MHSRTDIPVLPWWAARRLPARLRPRQKQTELGWTPCRDQHRTRRASSAATPRIGPGTALATWGWIDVWAERSPGHGDRTAPAQGVAVRFGVTGVARLHERGAGRGGHGHRQQHR